MSRQDTPEVPTEEPEELKRLREGRLSALERDELAAFADERRPADAPVTCASCGATHNGEDDTPGVCCHVSTFASKLSPETIAQILEQLQTAPVDRILARPENAEFRKEWEAVQLLQAQVHHWILSSMASTQYDEAMNYAGLVAREFPAFAHRRFAAQRQMTWLLERDPGPGILVRREGSEG